MAGWSWYVLFPKVPCSNYNQTLPFRLPVTKFVEKAVIMKCSSHLRHGTGHGVGHFLNVHEGPHGIGVRIGLWSSSGFELVADQFPQLIVLNNTPLKAGMTVSNEPGYYADGKFGIRIESIVLVREVKTPNNFGDKGYLGFENVTMSVFRSSTMEV